MTYDIKVRNKRQEVRMPQARLDKCRLTIIGVGAIGRQAALQAAAIGFPEIMLFDFDTVDVINLASQGFWESQLGMHKVDAVKDHMLQSNSRISVEPFFEKFTRLTAEEFALGEDPTKTDIVFMCVDSINTRSVLFESLKKLNILCVDARMAAETFRILSWSNTGKRPGNVEYYGTTLFPSSEAYQDGCTQQGTIHNASAAASFMVQQVSLFLRDVPCSRDTQLDFLSGSIIHR